ncbi:lasso peptide biosynthesis PqqD family chaperone [Streptomyces sp. P1-3]|uniref:lasso peptide biosynthesis PqqD family chaperone n=1 Tax=Streptomyces sp. P1-3 TaxID=3421658 RepID=UPI003D36D934
MALRLHPDISTADTEYGTVLLDGAGGRYWQLNATASAAFHALLDGGTVEAAAHRLTTEFDVDAARARDDVERLLSKLIDAKVVQA